MFRIKYIFDKKIHFFWIDFYLVYEDSDINLDDSYDPEDAGPTGDGIRTDDSNNFPPDDCDDLATVTADGRCGSITNLDRPEPRSLARILITIEFIFAIGSG